MTPLDRFAPDRRRIRFLPPNEVNEELFFVEEDRVVKADNTFSFANVRYEAPRRLPSRKIQVRFARKRPHERVVVYGKGERMGQAAPSTSRPMTAPQALQGGGDLVHRRNTRYPV
jgi:hypothetical protein